MRPVILLLLMLCAWIPPIRAGGQRQAKQIGLASTQTLTEWRTSVEYSTYTVTEICAKLVNVTGACRRRRNKWIDEPVVMTFDDGMEEVDRLLEPDAVWRIEPTALADPLTIQSLSRRTESPSPGIDVLESSEGRERPDPADASPRFGFGILSRYIFYTLLRPSSTATITITQVTTVTSFSVQSTYQTFFIQRCTPVPFVYPICSANR